MPGAAPAPRTRLRPAVPSTSRAPGDPSPNRPPPRARPPQPTPRLPPPAPVSSQPGGPGPGEHPPRPAALRRLRGPGSGGADPGNEQGPGAAAPPHAAARWCGPVKVTFTGARGSPLRRDGPGRGRFSGTGLAGTRTSSGNHASRPRCRRRGLRPRGHDRLARSLPDPRSGPHSPGTASPQETGVPGPGKGIREADPRGGALRRGLPLAGRVGRSPPAPLPQHPAGPGKEASGLHRTPPVRPGRPHQAPFRPDPPPQAPTTRPPLLPERCWVTLPRLPGSSCCCSPPGTAVGGISSALITILVFGGDAPEPRARPPAAKDSAARSRAPRGSPADPGATASRRGPTSAPRRATP